MAMNRQTILNKPRNTKSALCRLLSYIARYRAAVVLLLILCFVANILALLGPSLAGSAIHEAEAGLGKVNFERVWYYAKWMLVCYLASSAMIIGINILMMHISKRVARQMRSDATAKIMRLPVSFFDRSKTGDILSRLFYDVDVVSTCIATNLTSILTNVVTIVGSFVMMLVISPVLIIPVLAAIPASVWFTAYMRKKTQPRYKERSKKYGALNGVAEELLTGQKAVQAYAYTGRAKERFAAVNDDAVEGYYDAEYQGCSISPTINFISNVSLALIAMFGTLLYLFGYVSLAQISSFILYSRKFSGPVDEISSVINELFSALAAAERVFQLLDEEEEQADLPNAVELTDVKGEVELDHVSFGYVPGKTVLHDLSFKVEPGQMVAIVGATGAGKTTIINLLLRFYDPESGVIRLDGRDIREYTRENLRRSYAMVLQDTWVFKGTIFENIAYGKEDATMEEVAAAAKAAHIHSFIMQLPEGYNTVITEDGGNISKGQKQLLTIARAMLYDAKVLILDEATSNVDTGTERLVQRAMRELMRNKTCFVIAHRLSTIEHADRILVLENGDVAEQGTHEELLAAEGLYKKLYMSQFA